MNIRQLRQFVAIAKSGNISRAAKEQYISQPALTRSLKNLEEDLSVELIERRANGVFLTAYGEHLLEYANSIVGDSERVRRELKAMKSGLRGQLSIGVGPAFCSGAMAPALDQLLANGSRLEVKLVEGFVEDLCADLHSGALDVVLSLFPATFDVSDLSFSHLCDVESVLVSNSRHPLADVRTVTKKQLIQCNWVIADQKHAASTFREYLGRVEIPNDVHHVRASSLRIVKNMVLESDYVSILPKILISDELKNGQLRILDSPARPLVSVGGVAWRSSGFRSAALREFIEIIEQMFECGGGSSVRHNEVVSV